MEAHYRELSAVVATRSIVSMGVACCSWGRGPKVARDDDIMATPLVVEVFNIWLLTQQSFVTDPSSARFLLEHGFDFNKQYAQGLPYTPPSAKTKVCTIHWNPYTSIQWTPSNPATLGTRQSVLIRGVASFLGGWVIGSLTMSPLFQLRATPPSPGSMETLWACLLHRGVPLVLHNGWLDLLFLYHSFHGPLPPTSAALMADLTDMFPAGIYDTKALAQFQHREDATFLEYVFRIW